MKLGILGVGKMGGSILDGVIKSKIYDVNDIIIYTPNEAHREKYSKIGINLAGNEADLFTKSKIIILAIKPQMYDEVLKNAKSLDFKDKCITSLAPGKGIDYLKNIFPGATIVRAMPNTQALIGMATTTLYPSDQNELYVEVKKIFDSIGTSFTLDNENQIDECLPLNGSMPAYLYYFAKLFILNAEKYNISKDLALKLCCNTIISSAKMILESNDSIDTLIDNVCSKKGTTIEGLDALKNNNFDEAISKCYCACVNRARELSNK